MTTIDRRLRKVEMVSSNENVAYKNVWMIISLSIKKIIANSSVFIVTAFDIYILFRDSQFSLFYYRYIWPFFKLVFRVSTKKSRLSLRFALLMDWKNVIDSYWLCVECRMVDSLIVW